MLEEALRNRSKLRPNMDVVKFIEQYLPVRHETKGKGTFSPILRQKLRRFNGGLFEDCEALPLTAVQLELLIDASKAQWRDVEPAIFGTLLERALDPVERPVIPTITALKCSRFASICSAAAV